jgi:hypothetical protein
VFGVAEALGVQPAYGGRAAADLAIAKVGGIVPAERRRTMKRSSILLAAFGAAALLASGEAGNAEEAAPAIEPRAAELVRTMAKAVSALQTFEVATEFTLDVVLEGGQKLQYGGTSTGWLRRPNGLRSERMGERGATVLVYDGERVVLHVMPENFYATREAPGNLDAFLDFAQSRLDVAPPGIDLLYADGGLGLLEGVTSGMVVGTATIAGRRCHHVAFRAPGVDWQLWIEDGERPLPCRIVITTLDVAGTPEMSATFREWNTAPEISDSLFQFTPPEGAVEIQFSDPEAAPAGEGSK